MDTTYYRNHLRIAKRRIFDHLKSQGIDVVGLKHKLLIKFFLGQQKIERKNNKSYNDLIVELYRRGKLSDIKLIQKKPKKKEHENRDEYIAYLNSQKWKDFRIQALNHYGHQCTLCTNTSRLEVHHRTYKNLFNETLADVIILCHKCHKRHHGIIK